MMMALHVTYSDSYHSMDGEKLDQIFVWVGSDEVDGGRKMGFKEGYEHPDYDSDSDEVSGTMQYAVAIRGITISINSLFPLLEVRFVRVDLGGRGQRHPSGEGQPKPKLACLGDDCDDDGVGRAEGGREKPGRAHASGCGGHQQ